MGFKATRIPEIMYRSSEIDTVNGGKNECYQRKAKTGAERR
jgi:hypothetical protein